MSDYVSKLDSFQLDNTYSFDLVAGNGQTVTIDGAGHYLAKRPDKLNVKIENDLFARDYIYDGKTLTVVAPEEKYFAGHPAKPTIQEMLGNASSEIGNPNSADGPLRLRHGQEVPSGRSPRLSMSARGSSTARRPTTMPCKAPTAIGRYGSPRATSPAGQGGDRLIPI